VIENLPAWLAVAISAFAVIYSMASNRSKAIDTKVTDLALRVDKCEDRTTKLEAEMRHLPDKDTTQELRLAISEMNGQVQLLGERIRPIAAISDRLQEHLIGNMERA
jgi:hypothetical protein